MTRLRLIAASLWHFRRTHLAVALAVAVATAVLTGALLVGDSMRLSLRMLTRERLGRIESILLTERFFRAELAEELSATPAFAQNYETALPAILIPTATAEHAQEDITHRTGSVNLIATEPEFWQLSHHVGQERKYPESREVVLNEPLARELNARVGDTIVLRLPRSQAIPADSPLGRKTEGTANLARLRVIEIIPAKGFGRFSLRPNQQEPLNAYLSLPYLQNALDQPGRANAILLATGSNSSLPLANADRQQVFSALEPTLADYGLHLDRHRLTFPPASTNDSAEEQVIYDYYQLTTERMLFEPAVEATAAQVLETGQGGEPMITWLANDIARVPCDDPPALDTPPTGIPYSTITAIGRVPTLGPYAPTTGDDSALLAPGSILLNRWAAEQLEAQPGDCIAVRYFAPETVHGRAEQRTAQFTLTAILDLTEPAEPYSRRGDAVYDTPPAAANDPHYTPSVPGITDEASIGDWDPPFPFDMGRIRPEDDTYWENYRTTPKAFISLADGQRLWGSRFGDVTAYRIPSVGPGSSEQNELVADFETRLATVKDELGFAPLPVRRDGLRASAGTTPFAGLFLGFSFFLIAAAVMLVAILFRLGIEGRAEQIGVMLSLGLPRRQVGWLLAAEGATVAGLGSIVGVIGGWAYAWLMLAGLRTWWLAAVVTPFLELHYTPSSLLIGLVAGWVISVLTILWTLRRTRHVSVQRLITGEVTAAVPSRRGGRWGYALATVLAVAGIAVAISGTQASGEAQAGAFMGGGALLLSAALMLTHKWFQAGARGSTGSGFTLVGLAARSAARHPTRSTLTVGLVAMASFLIVAISAFRLTPSSAGSGGFPLLAESDRPIFVDLNTPAGRQELLGDEAAALAESEILSFRVLPGDDASCRNLYQPQQPRVLGVPAGVIEHFSQADATQFAWAKPPTAGVFFPDDAATLHKGPVPVVLDNNTALYSLHLTGRLGEEFEITFPGEVTLTFQVVGLLSNSIFQGSLLVSEADLLAHFPEIEGYQYFLLDVPAGERDTTEALLEEQLRDQGFLVQSSTALLEDLLAVQNTYLSTFQSLGALGLLLGTFGLAMVELRSVLERRSELALLQAAGFSRRRLAWLVLAENAALLLLGLGIGTLCAVAAVAPHFASAGGIGAPLISLAAVLVVGLVAGLAAVLWVVRTPLLPALRGE